MKFRTAAGSGLYVELDDSLNIVLVHHSNLARIDRLDVSDVEALRSALSAAKVMQLVYEEQSYIGK